MNKKEIKIRKEIEINKKSARRNYSNQTGITLIALVVTIVVLLILAGVSINALFGDSGIIEKAKEAQSKMNEAKENDLEGINELNQWMDNQVNETSSQKKIISFTIGQTTHQAEEGMTWGEWADSEYNTIGFEIDGINITIKDEKGTITSTGYLSSGNRWPNKCYGFN